MYYNKWYTTTTTTTTTKRIKIIFLPTRTSSVVTAAAAAAAAAAARTSNNVPRTNWFFHQTGKSRINCWIIDSLYSSRRHIHHQYHHNNSNNHNNSHQYQYRGRYSSLTVTSTFHPPRRISSSIVDPYSISGTRFLASSSSSSKHDEADCFQQDPQQQQSANIPCGDNYNYHKYNFDLVNNNHKSKVNSHIMPRRKKQAPNDSNSNQNSTKHPSAEEKPKFSKQYTDPETGMLIIEEGSCTMGIEATEMNDVFYNPVQVQNRDLSILMLQLYQERRQVMLKEQVNQFLIRREKLLLAQQEKEQEQLHQEQQQQQIQQENEEQTVTEGTSTATATADADDDAAATAADADDADDKIDHNDNMNTVNLPVVNSIETDIDPTADVPPPVKIDDDIYKSISTSDGIVIDIPKVKLQVLDALAASGLRSLRYWKECPDIIDHLTINDIDPIAAQRAIRNIERNQLADQLIPDTQPHGRPHGIRITTSDATDIMYNSRKRRHKRAHILPTMAQIQISAATYTPPPEITLTPEEESQLNWDVIDIDPYGSAATFIDAAVQAITNGGLLNVTCTDMRCLSGTQSAETAFIRYGSLPIKGSPYFHDYAIRMVLYAIAMAAGRHGRTMKPILSVGMDFYVRVFVEIHDDKSCFREMPTKTGMVFQSTQCSSFFTVPVAQMGGANGNTCQPSRIPHGVCPDTGAPLKVGGPIWLGPIHDPDVLAKAIQRLENPTNRFPNTNRNTSHQEPSSLSSSSSQSTDFIATRQRLHGLLTSCLEELTDVPLYYVLDEIAKSIHITMPPLLEIKSALVNAGYRVSGYHKDPRAIKTDAPSNVIWDVIRAWVKRRPLAKPPAPDSVAEKILSVEPSIDVDFHRPKIIHQTKETFAKAKRFPMNPERNWGPKPKAAHGRKRKSADN